MSLINPLDRKTFMKQMDRAETVGDISNQTIRRFWDWMYDWEDGLVQTCAFPVPTENKDAHEMGSGKWIHARSRDEFEEFCDTHSGLWRYHVYAGVNTLNEQPTSGRGEAHHINKVNHLSFDIETERESYSGASKREVWWCYKYGMAQAKHISENYGAWPMVVMSENGIHLHFKVDFPVTDELLHKNAHLYSKYLTHEAMNSRYADIIRSNAPDDIEFGQDDVSDTPRVMKVPGTLGIKSENGRLCGIIHEPDKSECGRIQPEDVNVPDKFIEAINQQEPNASNQPTEVEVTPEDANEDVLKRVKALVKKDGMFARLFEGDVSDYDSRSEAEFAFTMKLLNHGFEVSEINQIMWASGMSKWEEESQHYRERTIEEAYKRFDGDVMKDSTNGSFDFSRFDSSSKK